MSDEMAPEELDRFLRETRIAALTSLRADGRAVTVPVWFEWDGEVARVFSGRSTPKAQRVEADPRVTLTVFDGVGVPEAWASIEGAATLSSEGVTGLVERLANRYYPAQKAATFTESVTAHPERLVVITITPERIASYRTAAS